MRSALVESGTNMSPIETPRPTCGQKRSQKPDCAVHWLMPQSVGRKTRSPAEKIGAAPTRQSRRPAIGMMSAVEIEDGSTPTPACQDVQCNTFCVKGGKRKMQP